MPAALTHAPGSEALDDPSTDPHLVRRMLADIARANRWFGGRRALRRGMRRVLAGRRHDSVVVLDLGTGAGDLPRDLVAWGRRRGVTVRAVGVDRIAAAARLAHEAGVRTIVADAGALPVRDRGVDVVTISQFAHHLDDAGVVTLLREASRVARVGVVVADLQRSAWWRAAFAVGARVLALHPMTRTDGDTSIRRGFTASRLTALVTRAGAHAPRVERCAFGRIVASWGTA